MRRGDSGPPLAPTNSGPCSGRSNGTERDVIGDELCDWRDQRHHAFLAALADHGEHVARRRNRRALIPALRRCASRSHRASRAPRRHGRESTARGRRLPQYPDRPCFWRRPPPAAAARSCRSSARAPRRARRPCPCRSSPDSGQRRAARRGCASASGCRWRWRGAPPETLARRPASAPPALAATARHRGARRETRGIAARRADRLRASSRHPPLGAQMLQPRRDLGRDFGGDEVRKFAISGHSRSSPRKRWTPSF